MLNNIAMLVLLIFYIIKNVNVVVKLTISVFLYVFINFKRRLNVNY